MDSAAVQSIVDDHGKAIGRFLTATRAMVQATHHGQPVSLFEERALQLMVVGMVRVAMDQANKVTHKTREDLLEALGTEGAKSTEQAIQQSVSSADQEDLHGALMAHLQDPWAQIECGLTFSLDFIAAQAIRDGYRVTGVQPEALLLIAHHFKAARPLFGCCLPVSDEDPLNLAEDPCKQ